MASPLQLLTIIGARPQIIKAAAISRAVNGQFRGDLQETILHTGQHYDTSMSQVFFDELGIPRPDIDLGVGSGSHAAQTGRMMEGIERAIMERRPDIVLLYGDTNSTLAGAVAAAKLHVPVAHVEAGLRSFNKGMPEEINRIVCDHCSTWLFCPTETAMRNLAGEGFTLGAKERSNADHPTVLNVGDVMFDNSLHFAELAASRSNLLQQEGLGNGGYILATVHRDHNTDDHARLATILYGLMDAGRRHGLPVVLPLHPRTRKQLELLPDASLRRAIASGGTLRLLPPAGFLDMIALERQARLIITDSGGVQKEAHFFGKPCVVLRAETEWVELVEYGQAILVGADQELLHEAIDHFMAHDLPAMPAVFGDGRAAGRICSALLA